MSATCRPTQPSQQQTPPDAGCLPARRQVSTTGSAWLWRACPPIGRHRYVNVLQALEAVLPAFSPRTGGRWKVRYKGTFSIMPRVGERLRQTLSASSSDGQLLASGHFDADTQPAIVVFLHAAQAKLVGKVAIM